MSTRTFDCKRCGKQHLAINGMVWLSLDANTNLYHKTLPVGATDQGGFPFGATCARKELRRTEAMRTA